MIIGIDVDGVLAAFVSSLVKRINKKHGVDLKKSDINYWNYNENGISTVDEIIEASRDQEFIWSIKPVETSYMMNLLYDRHFIKIVTSRLPAAKKITYIWLTKYFQFDEVVWTHGKEKTKDYIEVDILIDDHIENLKKFIDTGGWCGILYDQPWNQDRTEIQEHIEQGNIYICKNWHEINHKIDVIRRGRNNEQP